MQIKRWLGARRVLRQRRRQYTEMCENQNLNCNRTKISKNAAIGCSRLHNTRSLQLSLNRYTSVWSSRLTLLSLRKLSDFSSMNVVAGCATPPVGEGIYSWGQTSMYVRVALRFRKARSHIKPGDKA